MYVIASSLPAIGAPAQAPGSSPPPATAVAGSASPDALYAQREDLAKARDAARLWAERLKAAPTDFEAAWKLARAQYWLGSRPTGTGRRADLEAGIEAARVAIRLQPGRPEGHFWLGANMGGLAESFGVSQGIKYRKPVKAALEEVVRLDPAYLGGSADRALGRWYFKVPGLFGGSNRKSEEHLRKALTYDPQSTATWYFLAETLADMGRKAEARQAAQRVLDVPFNPDWTPEDKEWKAKAQALIRTLSR